MAQGLPVFEWFLYVLYLLVPPQWTVGTQRLDQNQHHYLQTRMLFTGEKTTPVVGIYNELKKFSQS